MDEEEQKAPTSRGRPESIMQEGQDMMLSGPPRLLGYVFIVWNHRDSSLCMEQRRTKLIFKKVEKMNYKTI